MVLDIDDVNGYSDIQDLLYYFESTETALAETSLWKGKDFLYAYKQLSGYKQSLTKRIRDLQAIDRKVEKGKKDVVKWLESKEYWDSHFENHKDDMAEKDAEQMREV